MNDRRSEPRGVRIVLCADDYGLSPGVGAAIRDLVARGRLTATGCMVTTPFWAEEAVRLAPLAGRCDVGLHVTLTDHCPAGAMPGLAPGGRLPGLKTLMARAVLRRLDRAEIEAEIARQLDAFERASGRPPDFIDGHHHVHQLPVVRDALLAVYERRLRGTGTWLRYCAEPLAAIAKRRAASFHAAMVSLLGRRLAARGRGVGIPGNRGFTGVRRFAGDEDFPALMTRFLRGVRDGGLIMVHPAIPDAALAAADAVVAQRRGEYDFLLSDAFAGLLARANVRLARFGEATAGTTENRDPKARHIGTRRGAC